MVRDASEIVKIRPKADTDALLLSLELPAVNASRYRATLLNETSEVLWQGEDLEPNLYDALLIALPSSYLAPGVYRITLEGLPAAGAEEAGAEIAEAGLAEDFEFRVLPGE